MILDLLIHWGVGLTGVKVQCLWAPRLRLFLFQILVDATLKAQGRV